MSKPLRTALSQVSQALQADPQRPSSHSFIEFRREEVEQSIAGRFEDVVRRYPERIAIKTKNEVLTYEELNHAANRVAGSVLEACGANDGPVVLFLEKGAALIASILGVLKAGKV